MSDSVIHVESIGKCYRIRHRQERPRYLTLRDVLTDRTKSVARRLWSLAANGKAERRKQKSVEDFWALKDVSLEVRQGETLGIIGRNGAGKSTLLKVLSRITEPTTGRVRIKGRVASLLEVGTGFHPELTGQENIFLNGAILGMTKAEIKRKFDEIVAFAEVEQFLDTPVKYYSSGMYVRLAFAVAAHLEPEILIVDEVLAVGDAQFQKKCLGRMHDLAIGGRTVLFVSHNFSMVTALCGRVALLDHGAIKTIGTPGEILRMPDTEGARTGKGTYHAAGDQSETPRFLSIEVVDVQAGQAVCLGKEVAFRVEIDGRNEPHLLLGLHVHNERQEQVIHSSSEFAMVGTLKGRKTILVTIPPELLNVGRYECSFVLGVRNRVIFDNLARVVSFEIGDPRPAVALTTPAEWQGVLSPRVVRWACVPKESQKATVDLV